MRGMKKALEAPSLQTMGSYHNLLRRLHGRVYQLAGNAAHRYLLPRVS